MPKPRCHGGEYIRTGLAESTRALRVRIYMNPDEASRERIASIILISPLWPTRPWWPLLLPQSRSLLTNLTRELAPPIESPANETSGMCHILELFKAKEFKTDLSRSFSNHGTPPPENQKDGVCRGLLIP